jgi:NADH:ubiquinone oxidoreductase subunit 6 (subunit J)
MNAVLVLIALATVGSAGAAMAGRNLLRSVLLLAVSWSGVAAFFLWAGAEFAAFAQVLVYVGAISMVVLFAVLLTRRSRENPAPAPSPRSRAVYAVFAAGAVAAVLVAAVALAPSGEAPAAPPTLTVVQIGAELMGPHAAALLIAGVLLTVALIGAVVLAAGGQDEKQGGGP